MMTESQGMKDEQRTQMIPTAHPEQMLRWTKQNLNNMAYSTLCFVNLMNIIFMNQYWIKKTFCETPTLGTAELTKYGCVKCPATPAFCVWVLTGLFPFAISNILY